MARLPRYQESGLISADIPRLDFANLREQARVTESVSSALDRISQFAFGQVAEERKKLNQMMAIQLRTDLEMQSSMDLASIAARVETGQINNIAELRDEFSAMAKHGSKTLLPYSTEQAAAYVNTIAGQGRAIMSKFSSIVVNNSQARFNLMATESIRAATTNLETVFETAPTMQEVNLQISNQLATFRAIAVQTSNPVETMRAFEKSVFTARDNVLVREFTSPSFADSPSSILQKLDKNDVGRFSDVWKSMTLEEKDAVRDRILRRTADVYTVTERERKAREENNKIIGMDVRDRFFKGQLGPQETIAQLKALNDISPAEMRAIAEGEVGGARQELLGVYESMVDKNQLGENDIDDLARRGAINWRQANSLKRQARTSGTDESEARRFINRSLGVPSDTLFGFEDERTRAAEVERQLILARDQARQEGRAFNSMAEAQKLVTARQQQSDVLQQNAAKESLNQKLNSLSLRYRVDYTDEELKNLNIGPKDRKIILDRSKAVRGEK